MGRKREADEQRTRGLCLFLWRGAVGRGAAGCLRKENRNMWFAVGGQKLLSARPAGPRGPLLLNPAPSRATPSAALAWPLILIGKEAYFNIDVKVLPVPPERGRTGFLIKSAHT